MSGRIHASILNASSVGYGCLISEEVQTKENRISESFRFLRIQLLGAVGHSRVKTVARLTSLSHFSFIGADRAASTYPSLLLVPIESCHSCSQYITPDSSHRTL